MLAGKKIILGITGSIAAYKAALLVRLLVKEGAEVKVVMTESAKRFVGDGHGLRSVSSRATEARTRGHSACSALQHCSSDRARA